MDYNPKQERDIRNEMMMAPGEYDFEVVDAKEKTSKAGNDMIELSIRVFPTDGGSPRLMRDWLVGGSTLGELKINRFCHATGIQDVYFSGGLSALSCVGVGGKCRLTITSSADYGDQNGIKDYIVASSGDEYSQVAATPTKANEALNEFATEQAALKDEDADCPF